MRAILAVSLLALGMPAMAAAPSAESEAGSENVIVTATRLKRPAYDSVYPAASVTAAEIDRRGITNLLDALNTLPITGFGASPKGGQTSQGVGSAFVNLFDLGSQRTLTLVNGRRFVAGNQASLFGPNAPGLQVDLNVVPVSLVDRVEVVSVGGAPSYGADAVAGTVNVVLKRDFEGTEVQGRYGTYESGVGDSWQVSALNGTAFDKGRGHLQIAVEHEEGDGFSNTAGPFLRRGFALAANPRNTLPFTPVNGPNGVFDNILIFDNRIPSITRGGAIFRTGDAPTYLTPAGRQFLIDHPGADPTLALFNGTNIAFFPGGVALPALITRELDGARPEEGFRPSAGSSVAPTRVAVPLLFNPDGTIGDMDVGLIAADQPLGGFNAVGGDGLDLVPLTTLASSLTRTLIAATGDYDISAHARAYAEVFFADAEGVEPFNQAAYNANVFGTGMSGALGFRTDNPFLTGQARQVLADEALNLQTVGQVTASLGWASFSNPGAFGGCRVPGMWDGAASDCPAIDPDTRVFFVSRDYEDILGGTPSRSETKTLRGVLGADGDFQAFGRSWSWDASFTYGRSRTFSASPSLGQATFNAARDAVEADGAIVCRVNAGGAQQEAARFVFRYTNIAPVHQAPAIDPTSPAPPPGFYRRALGDPLGASEATLDACAPLDLFGEGRASEAARDYVTAIYETENTNAQYVAELNLHGTVADLPGGPLQVATGFAWRREAADFRSANDTARYGLSRSVAFLDIADKSFDSRELYAEVAVPILGNGFDLPFAEEVVLTASWRGVDHSLAGRDDAWTLGLTWAPDDWITLRAATTASIRAPSLTELYLPNSSAFNAGIDPCDVAQIGGGASPERRRANCEAAATEVGFGGLATFRARAPVITLQGSFSGNPDLRNEQARSDSVGFVVQYDGWLGNASLSADWLDIRLHQAIESAGLTQLLQACYDAPAYPAAACGQLSRDSQFNIVSFQGSYLNAGYRKFRGAQAAFDWRFGVGELGARLGLWADRAEFGDIGIHLDYAYIDRLVISVSGTGSDLNIEGGETGRPTNEHQLTLAYSTGPYDAALIWSHQGEVRFDRQAAAESREQKGLSAYDAFDLSLAYTLEDRVRFQMVVTNLFDVLPPFGTGSLAYDQVGRRYQFAVKVAM
ncbi:MAG: TonB-dependent receptor [Alphaproteobacteria bacterium]|nr:TonB-dependent receptor [Alphaproteobacteria bacterium]